MSEKNFLKALGGVAPPIKKLIKKQVNMTIKEEKDIISIYFPYYKGYFYCIHCQYVFKANNNVTCPRCGKLIYKDTGYLDDLLRTYWNSKLHLSIRKKIDDFLSNKKA